MSERIYQEINRAYGFDENFCFRYGKDLSKKLAPCEPINDEDLCIGLIDNGNLKAKRLLLFEKDKEKILVTIPETGETCELSLPGKSGLIILTPEVCDRNSLKEMVINTFGPLHSATGRHLYVGQVLKMKEVGWIAYWAPLQLRRLIDHVRIVAERTIKNGEEPTMDDAENLRSVLRKIN